MAAEKKKMISQKDVFDVSGPVHLASVNWLCPHHQRSVIASLVQGVYTLDRDRQFHRHGSEARAPAWWERFHFKVNQNLLDDADGSIFGALFEYRPPANFQNATVSHAPRFVVAFRGTLLKKRSIVRDIQLDMKIIKNGLEKTSRFQRAIQTIRTQVAEFGFQSVWIAGHSLGAAIALLAGKNMAREHKNLNAFLFNPPIIAAPLEWINDDNAKKFLYVVDNFTTAVFARIMKDHSHTSDAFILLSSWLPHLFVNKADWICSAYIGYFESRQTMKNIGATKIGQLATENSIKDLALSAVGNESSESLHLLPSAYLTVNSTPAPHHKHAHGIQQWWRADQIVESKEYLSG